MHLIHHTATTASFINISAPKPTSAEKHIYYSANLPTMKKMGEIKIMALVCMFFFVSLSLVSAQEPAEPQQQEPSTTQQQPSIPTQTQQFQAPPWLERGAQIFLGIEQGLILTILIASALIWIILWIIIARILQLISLFRGAIAWLISFATTTLIGLSGVTGTLGRLALSFGQEFKFLEQWSAGALLVTIILIILIGFILAKLLSYFQRKIELEEAEHAGTEMGKTMGMLNRMKETFDFTRKV